MAKCTANEIIRIALEEIGYLEKKSNANLDSKTANAGNNNYTKYANLFDSKYTNFYNGKKNGYPWCDVFVDWCFVKAFGVRDAMKITFQKELCTGAGCSYSAQFYKDNNSFKTSPKRGDQIFFYVNGEINHTGIVYSVDKTYVYTIEGNTSSKEGVIDNGGAVAKKKYKLDNKSIAGYGRPMYGVDDIIWRKAKTTDILNCRLQANISSKVLTTFSRNQEIYVGEKIFKGSGYSWVKTKREFNNNGKKVHGYVCTTYIKYL